jgi:hypothetical protein
MMAEFEYTVKELPALSIWKKLKGNFTLFRNNKQWLVFNTKLLVAQVIESKYNVTSSNPVRP